MSRPDFPGGLWCGDFEFHPGAGLTGNPLVPVCLVVHDIATGATHRYGQDALAAMDRAPFPTDASALFVAYNAAAEMACFQVLGWPFPVHLLDLYAEFRNLTNGLPLPAGKSLLGALIYFGEPAMEAAKKDCMRELILTGGPWSPAEQAQILDYCEADVRALVRLSQRMGGLGMSNLIDWPRALLRGQYAVAAAMTETLGIPIDAELLQLLRDNAPRLRRQLIEVVDTDFGVYEDGRFKTARFVAYLHAQQIPWPCTLNGHLKLDDDTFADMAKAYPQIGPLHQLRKTLVQLRDLKLSVGEDGRNRAPSFPFSSQTGRNQPSTSQFIFGLAAWLRGLIRPQPGWANAYVDWSQQELAIAAALSGDTAMQAAYRSADFYMSLAILAGAAPAGATKATHADIRERFKVCALGVLFGMGEDGLALRLGISTLEARRLLIAHQRSFPQFWQWSQAVADHALLTGSLQTVFGWTLHVPRQPNVRSLRNFPMQAHGAEMMRLAHIELARRGIRVCASVHDAFLIEAPEGEIDAAVVETQAVMCEASAIVLDGFAVRSEARIVRYPARFLEPKGVPMWNRVMTLLGRDDACVKEKI